MEAFLLSSLRNVNVSIEDDISQYGRGLYDLLIRPAKSQTKVEQTIGLVEENYLGVGSGGISLATWEEIKAMEDVEIAAPVAALGYFTGESKSITLPIPTTPHLYQVQFSTTDGVNSYPLSRSGITAINPFTDPVKGQQVDFVFDSIGDAEVEQYINPTMDLGISIMLPETYHLLVGIDPIEEEHLTGISFSDLQNPSFVESHYTFAGDAPIIHVLQLSDANVSMELTIEKEPLPDDFFTKLKEKGQFPDAIIFSEIYGTDEYEQALQLVKQIFVTNADSRQTYQYDLTDLLIPFESEPFNLNEQYELSTDPTIFSANVGSTANYYVTSAIDYHIDAQNNLTADIIGEHEQVPIYRSLTKEGGTFHELAELPFVLNIAGSYSIKEREEAVASSPLGLYYLSDMYTGEGDKVVPTSTPGSFVPAPAHGVIDIRDAEIIKGKEPIDAIRVKMANISTYDQAAIKKIEDLALELHKQGLHVDIIAGASDQLIPVMVENVGIVEQAWTTLGAAASIEEQWQQASFILAGLFFLVAFFYIANRLMFWKAQKANEIKVYQLLGWEEKAQQRLLSNELNLMYGCAYLLSFTFIVGIERSTEVGGVVYLNHLLISILLYILILILRLRKSKVVTVRERKTSHASMLIRNLRYYQRYMKLNSWQLFMTSLMSIFVSSIIWITYQQSGVTKLGELINENLFILLLVLLLISFGLALLTVTETITNFLAVRRKELQTFIKIGWSHRDIWFLNAKEIASWSIPAMLLGYIMGTGIAIFSFSFYWNILWFGLGTFSLFALITICYTAWVISHQLKQLYK